MSLAYNFMSDDGEKPVRKEQFGVVIEAFDRFGDRGAVLRGLETVDEMTAAEFDALKEKRWRHIQEVVDATTPFMPDAAFLPNIDEMLQKLDAALHLRKRNIELGVMVIDGLVAEDAGRRIPPDLLRQALMTTMKQRIREHDDLVDQYLVLEAFRSEVDPDDRPIPRLPGESTKDYLERLSAL